MPRMLLLVALLNVPMVVADEPAAFSFQKREKDMDILIDGQHFATYVWADPVITRPYFKQITASHGNVQITRHHPPGPDEFDDHATFHPGIWWGFGDVGGNDYWRLKAKIVGGDFVEPPRANQGRAEFAVRNRMLDEDAALFCWQTCRYTLLKRRSGILLVCESELLREEDDFWLGDQEEMGIAVRVTKSIATKMGGKIKDSEGRSEQRELRTNQADWCDYSGPVAGKFGGITLMNDPRNFRKPWWHNVDTGLLVANPLGESELGGNGKKRENVLVKKSTPFRLRYGVLIHLHDRSDDYDANAAYADFLEMVQ